MQATSRESFVSDYSYGDPSPAQIDAFMRYLNQSVNEGNALATAISNDINAEQNKGRGIQGTFNFYLGQEIESENQSSNLAKSIDIKESILIQTTSDIEAKRIEEELNQDHERLAITKRDLKNSRAILDFVTKYLLNTNSIANIQEATDTAEPVVAKVSEILVAEDLIQPVSDLANTEAVSSSSTETTMTEPTVDFAELEAEERAALTKAFRGRFNELRYEVEDIKQLKGELDNSQIAKKNLFFILNEKIKTTEGGLDLLTGPDPVKEVVMKKYGIWNEDYVKEMQKLVDELIAPVTEFGIAKHNDENEKASAKAERIEHFKGVSFSENVAIETSTDNEGFVEKNFGLAIDDHLSSLPSKKLYEYFHYPERMQTSDDFDVHHKVLEQFKTALFVPSGYQEDPAIMESLSSIGLDTAQKIEATLLDPGNLNYRKLQDLVATRLSGYEIDNFTMLSRTPNRPENLQKYTRNIEIAMIMLSRVARKLMPLDNVSEIKAVSEVVESVPESEDIENYNSQKLDVQEGGDEVTQEIQDFDPKDNLGDSVEMENNEIAAEDTESESEQIAKNRDRIQALFNEDTASGLELSMVLEIVNNVSLVRNQVLNDADLGSFKDSIMDLIESPGRDKDNVDYMNSILYSGDRSKNTQFIRDKDRVATITTESVFELVFNTKGLNPKKTGIDNGSLVDRLENMSTSEILKAVNGDNEASLDEIRNSFKEELDELGIDSNNVRVRLTDIAIDMLRKFFEGPIDKKVLYNFEARI